MENLTVNLSPSYIPATLEEITGLAKAFVSSGYFQDTQQVAQAIVKITAGKELGLPPVFAMQNINLIKGKLCSSANTLALLVKRSGKYNYRIKEHDDNHCTITFYELDGGKWVEVGESAFTIDDARRAGLVKPDSGWVKFPRAMLFSRAISQGARIYCPDAISGIYTTEEMTAVVSAEETPPKEPYPVMDVQEPHLVKAAEELGAQPVGVQNIAELKRLLMRHKIATREAFEILGINSFNDLVDLDKAWEKIKQAKGVENG